MKRLLQLFILLLSLFVGVGEALPSSSRQVKNCACACAHPCGNVCCCVEKAPAPAHHDPVLFAPSMAACGSTSEAIAAQTVNAKGGLLEESGPVLLLAVSCRATPDFSTPQDFIVIPSTPPPRSSRA